MPAWPGGSEVGEGKKKVSCVGQNAGYAVFQSDSPPGQKKTSYLLVVNGSGLVHRLIVIGVK